MMTRKDYVETAKILNLFVDKIDSRQFEDLIFEFSEWFRSDNPRFNENKFWDACVKQLENAQKKNPKHDLKLLDLFQKSCPRRFPQALVDNFTWL